MNASNTVILMGRLTADPDVRYTQGEHPTSVARYTLAVDKVKNGNREADFIRCVAWGKTAEFAQRYLNKGTKIAIAGEIHTGSYTNKDGQKISTTEVYVDSHTFCESRQQPQQGGYQPQPTNYSPAPQQTAYRPQQAPQEQYQQQTFSQKEGLPEGWLDIPDNVDHEGLPFN